mmetsp:Transcript_2943/g.5346  ORF Transcript_2943/g.5346 Transcript_2943/m.5346 type:complete len:248 (+) Transcript_2943:2-745(+)
MDDDAVAAEATAAVELVAAAAAAAAVSAAAAAANSWLAAGIPLRPLILRLSTACHEPICRSHWLWSWRPHRWRDRRSRGRSRRAAPCRRRGRANGRGWARGIHLQLYFLLHCRRWRPHLRSFGRHCPNGFLRLGQVRLLQHLLQSLCHLPVQLKGAGKVPRQGMEVVALPNSNSASAAMPDVHIHIHEWRLTHSFVLEVARERLYTQPPESFIILSTRHVLALLTALRTPLVGRSHARHGCLEVPRL